MKTIAQGLKETLPADIYELAMKYQDPNHYAHKRDWKKYQSERPVDDGIAWAFSDEGHDFWRLVNDERYQQARELLRKKKAESAPDLFQTVKDAVKEALAEREQEQEQRMKEMWKEVMASPVIRRSDPAAPRLLTEEEVKRVEVTHVQTVSFGRNKDNSFINHAIIYYLGKCEHDGDMFMQQTERYIHIYKGHLNAKTTN